jgi:catechol 1,2-dioxygenase
MQYSSRLLLVVVAFSAKTTDAILIVSYRSPLTAQASYLTSHALRLTPHDSRLIFHASSVSIIKLLTRNPAFTIFIAITSKKENNMQRRKFVNTTALCAVAISATGFIRFDGKRYVGDCATTSDILGPFYRPDSPVRTNMVPSGASGDLIEISGTVVHKDCITPYKHAKVELWHCSSEGVYDNESPDFLYRSTAYTDTDGHYVFNTILPVPYDIGGGMFRPAHFHMMVSAEGYVPLVTQLYFTGDPHLAGDSSSSSPLAKGRILDIEMKKDGTKKVVYNVGMSDKMRVEDASLDKITGQYTHEKNPEQKMEFFKNENDLWMKNEIYGMNLDYLGHNEFQFAGGETLGSPSFIFKIGKNGSVRLTMQYKDEEGKKVKEVFVKG